MIFGKRNHRCTVIIPTDNRRKVKLDMYLDGILELGVYDRRYCTEYLAPKEVIVLRDYLDALSKNKIVEAKPNNHTIITKDSITLEYTLWGGPYSVYTVEKAGLCTEILKILNEFSDIVEPNVEYPS